MTEAEKAIIDLLLSGTRQGEELTDELSDMVRLLREERCPQWLLERARAAELARIQAMDEYSAEVGNMKLNWPPELVDAALNRVRKDLRQRTYTNGSR